ncbi:type II toxin-antitoxin system tRNA(fMet)-specific endonuclease VapC [Variovorax sp. VNK109]|uniref:type II toxin-antitoxin system tRNA(fMet)-specific endonuclease VapC n=1 Tax=Variovorax sp. VNK109 TaxID=3400919 RepID=UPI003C030EFD
MKYLLDTNTCIYIINQRPAHVLQRFREHHIEDIGLSAMSAAELAFGVAKSGSAKNEATLQRFLAPLNVLPFDVDCIWHYGHLRAKLEKAGTPIGSIDTMIAAHALALDATLITNNVNEFARVPGLRCDNWALPTT